MPDAGAAADRPLDRATVKEFWRRLKRENSASPKPWPTCKRCGGFIHPVDEEPHWLFARLCDGCGIRRTENLVRRVIKAHGRRRGLRALRRLASK
jgi:hypothetical protein